MSTFERVSEVQAQARQELLEAIITNQATDRARYEQDKKEAQERSRSLMLKIGVGIVLLVAAKMVEFAPVIISLLHKP